MINAETVLERPPLDRCLRCGCTEALIKISAISIGAADDPALDERELHLWQHRSTPLGPYAIAAWCPSCCGLSVLTDDCLLSD